MRRLTDWCHSGLLAVSSRLSLLCRPAYHNERVPLWLPPAATATLKPAPLAPSPRPVLSIPVDCRSSAKEAVAVVVDSRAAAGASTAGTAGAAGRTDLSVMAGIAAMLRNPHHAAFFATALLMGVG